jgi:prolyl-tRNA editing enzyme YbaK/EbsC (Cys-tRNA(Pro) deacylase)
VTGYEPGAIAPVGMGQVRTILMDPALLEEESVTISSGHPEAGIRLRSADLLRAVSATVVTVASSGTG